MSSAPQSIPPAAHAYPMVRSGGLFLALVGLGLIGAVLFSGDALVNYTVFFAGVALGVAALMFSGPLSFGSPKRFQVAALVAAVVLEVALLNIQGRVLPAGTDESVRWLWISMIVGVHFLPMAISFGPRLLALGAICIANAIAGLLLTAVPYEAFGLFDGFAKLAFGIWLLSDKPGGRKP
jgi:hypothetical protein